MTWPEKRRWPDRTTEQNTAYVAVYYAVRSGRINVDACSHCGDMSQLDCHHPYGYKSGWVVVLCKSCHRLAEVGEVDCAPLLHQWVYRYIYPNFYPVKYRVPAFPKIYRMRKRAKFA